PRDKTDRPRATVLGTPNDEAASARPKRLQEGKRIAEVDPLEHQVEKIHAHAAALMSEWKQPAPVGFEDPIDNLLRQTRQRLDALEREVSLPPPRKATG